ncbi:hypothetical protein [Photobacterium sp. TY1-4]|uniref:hypothetical protein n=1 Tax=Photobacterium sp. TY1-4 TaxID=2899122 RepID=UPI0021BE20D3|nr:hypothetical protein [Photobacterium sp. TY1-4]UXI04115.1 hypothetical protein NH461_18590 [Photobacterium sp. TY1-4]
MNKRLTLGLLLVTLSCSAQWVAATEQRHFSGSQPLLDHHGKSEITQLKLKVPTGNITIRSAESDNVTYEVNVKEEPSSWFGADLDDLVLEHQVVGQTLYLTINEEDVSQQWTVTVPKSLALNVRLGVGNVEASAISQPFTADIGVGAVWLALDPARFNQIDANVAVGEIQVRGLDSARVKLKRQLVSETLNYTGQGDHPVAIQIGVGDVNISQHTVPDAAPDTVAVLTQSRSLSQNHSYY